MRTGYWACTWAAMLATACSGQAAEPPAQEVSAETGERSREGDMKVTIIAGGQRLTAELVEGAAARDFAAMLPLDLTLRDYHGTEKIADLPSRLSIEGAPGGIDPMVGDLAYYAPWGNIALFYRDFGYSGGLIRLGRIEGDVSILAGSDPIPVRIEQSIPSAR